MHHSWANPIYRISRLRHYSFSAKRCPLCKTNNIYVPGCSGTVGADYANRNPFFYKFTCYVSGTLGFLITPQASFEDYDWQLFDITGQNPEDIFTNNNLVVTGNWSGNYGPTGASVSGVNFIQCASDPGTQNTPTSDCEKTYFSCKVIL
ncbi:MAG: hypothetical protein JJE22_16695 [Bacteroidia bacterium]|nr:hypothetical protein [Bacteroidia bacterium]